jgi:hypothetical protein
MGQADFFYLIETVGKAGIDLIGLVVSVPKLVILLLKSG